MASNAAVPASTSRLSPAILDAAADPHAVRMHPLTLRFAAPDLEAAFKEQYQHESLRHTRFAVIMGVFLVAVYGILDALILAPVRNELWLIRFGFICPVLLVVMVASFVPGTVRYIEWVLSAGIVVAGTGILALALVSPSASRYYTPALLLVLMYNYVFLKLRFAIATLVGWTLVAVYFLAELLVRDTPWPMLISNVFLWVSASMIGMFAAYFLESLARRNFVQEKLVRRVREYGSYRLVALLGEGGMGEVWRAEHQLLARPAAIKLIRAEKLGATDPEGRRATLRRFEREAQATALLRSPHTIQVYDFGISDAGVFYYVMELLDGFDLDTLVRRFGGLASQRVVHLLAQVCDSLGEAHEQGLIHRDIKPANIYVCRYGRTDDFVKVLDFGLVKSGRELHSIDASATAQGQFVGTPSCMAPEQIAPDGLVDARTDIYALGCVAYWLLTSTEVFRAPTALQVMAHHLHTQPTPPSARTTHAISAAVDRVVLACLEKRPEDRPQTADGLARELVACADSEAWSSELARAWWSEHGVSVAQEPWSGEERVVTSSLAGHWRG